MLAPLWARVPTWVQKALTDFVETFLASLAVLNLAVPGSLAEAEAQAVLVGTAALVALIAAARRAAPAAWLWLTTNLLP